MYNKVNYLSWTILRDVWTILRLRKGCPKPLFFQCFGRQRVKKLHNKQRPPSREGCFARGRGLRGALVEWESSFYTTPLNSSGTFAVGTGRAANLFVEDTIEVGEIIEANLPGDDGDAIIGIA